MVSLIYWRLFVSHTHHSRSGDVMRAESVLGVSPMRRLVCRLIRFKIAGSPLSSTTEGSVETLISMVIGALDLHFSTLVEVVRHPALYFRSRQSRSCAKG